MMTFPRHKEISVCRMRNLYRVCRKLWLCIPTGDAELLWNLLLQKWPRSKAIVHYHALELDTEVLTWDWGSHKADDLGFPGQGEAIGAPEQPHRHPPRPGDALCAPERQQLRLPQMIHRHQICRIARKVVMRLTCIISIACRRLK